MSPFNCKYFLKTPIMLFAALEHFKCEMLYKGFVCKSLLQKSRRLALPAVKRLFQALIAIVSFSICAVPVCAQNPNNPNINVPLEVYNGQAFLLDVTAPDLEEVEISWSGKNLTVLAEPYNAGKMQALALLPVDLDSKEEVRILKLNMTIAGKQIKEHIKIRVLKKQYPEQQLTVDPKFVELSAADLARHQKERKITSAITATRSPTRYWQLPMLRPVPGATSSAFGLQRMFNGVPRSAHKGLDLRAAQGDPISACADGTVALAANHFFSGNVVYLDHGLGVFSVYAHMSKIEVAEGDFVKAGDQIGLIGSTGRVTGPHLHLSILVLSTSVDPNSLLAPQTK